MKKYMKKLLLLSLLGTSLNATENPNCKAKPGEKCPVAWSDWSKGVMIASTVIVIFSQGTQFIINVKKLWCKDKCNSCKV